MDAVDVVTHVHWDREWYRTFDGFRARLVELVDAVLDQLDAGTLDTFLLDGQTSVVEDYLELRPDAHDRLASLVRAGRLRIGPWYVLADKTLVSGESLIRNLLVGRAQSLALGGRTEVGYCPDMFGHPPELPSVLAGFGIDRALVWRGADPAVPVFRWRAPDGATVLTLRNRYYEPEVLWEPAGAEQRFASWLADRRAESPRGPWLLLNGGDHLAPRDLADTLAGLDTEVALRQATLESHLAALDVDDLPVVEGPLRRPGVAGAFLLAGTLSVRPRQKRLHADVQALLEGLAEPLAARALAAGVLLPGVGSEEPVGAADERTSAPSLRGLLGLAWRHVLQGQPHDSVCGCGTDQVAQDTVRRYEAAAEVGTQVLDRALRRLGMPTGHAVAEDAEEIHLAVLNPLATPRCDEVVTTIDVPAGASIVAVHDAHGASLPFTARAGEAREDLDTDIATLPTWPRTRRTELRVGQVAVPAAGWTTLRCQLVHDEARGPEASSRSASPDGPEGWDGSDDRRIAAGDLVVEAAGDGTLVVRDVRLGRTLTGVGRLVDTGDRGDTYNHDVPRSDRTIVPEPRRVRRVTTAVAEELHVQLTAELPVGLREDRDARATATTPLHATIVARLVGPEPDRVELHVEVATDARDHRLRLHVPTGREATTFATDSGFTWQVHPVPTRAEVAEQTEPGLESDPLTQPAHRLVATGEGDDAVALLVHGTPEVAAVPAGEQTELAVTLLRAVGQLGRHDLRTRTMGAGPPIPTPQAQEPGVHRARVALVLGGDEVAITGRSWAWRSPLTARALAGPPVHAEVDGMRVDGAQLSAWKPAEQGDDWVVRVANPTSTSVDATVRLPVDAEVTPCRLDETSVAGGATSRVAAGDAVACSLAPGGTASWRVSPTSR
ncbi:MAG: hypothetical protein JJT89_16125 [Nitriliruptoraceae bacterium]|nr:hypothetical protein [Nitriliruptoraceae bacterium]